VSSKPIPPRYGEGDHPKDGGGAGTTAEIAPFESLLSRPTLIVAASLAAAAGLAWLWLLRTAAPGEVMAMPIAPWSAAYLLSAFTMWSLMMVAMMLPSAAPMILFYARFARRSGMRGAAGATALFVSAYLAIWALFSLGAALLQAALVAAGAASAMELALGDRRVAGLLLALAGLYQLTPLKRACLASCRSPLDFLMRLWRPGPAGAVRLGLAHGVYCLGCCWVLMLLLFVGGVMNLAWIAGLALLVMAEKLAPARWPVSSVLGAVLVVAAVALVLLPA
jgi:predicted metal-binding membrane protein